VERNILFQLQKVHGVFQVLSGFFIIEGKRKELLDIQKLHGSRSERLHVIVFHIALQFRQIKRSPGAKDVIIGTAPVKELIADIRKRLAGFQFLHLKVDELAGDMMQLMIDLRFYQSGKLIDHFAVFIAFYGTDLHDLKGDGGIFGFMGRISLIPFQVNNDIIHIRNSCMGVTLYEYYNIILNIEEYYGKEKRS
jgi:hypothetical protein